MLNIPLLLMNNSWFFFGINPNSVVSVLSQTPVGGLRISSRWPCMSLVMPWAWHTLQMQTPSWPPTTAAPKQKTSVNTVCPPMTNKPSRGSMVDTRSAISMLSNGSKSQCHNELKRPVLMLVNHQCEDGLWNCGFGVQVSHLKTTYKEKIDSIPLKRLATILLIFAECHLAFECLVDFVNSF